MNRQQFGTRDAERLQIGGDVGMGEAGERSAIRFRHQRMKRGKALHMHFVENRARPGGFGFSRKAPRECGIDNPALLHRRRAVPAVERQVFVWMIQLIAE
jgi:hypothetical protein